MGPLTAFYCSINTYLKQYLATRITHPTRPWKPSSEISLVYFLSVPLTMNNQFQATQSQFGKYCYNLKCSGTKLGFVLNDSLHLR